MGWQALNIEQKTVINCDKAETNKKAFFYLLYIGILNILEHLCKNVISSLVVRFHCTIHKQSKRRFGRFNSSQVSELGSKWVHIISTGPANGRQGQWHGGSTGVCQTKELELNLSEDHSKQQTRRRVTEEEERLSLAAERISGSCTKKCN